MKAVWLCKSFVRTAVVLAIALTGCRGQQSANRVVNPSGPQNQQSQRNNQTAQNNNNSNQNQYRNPPPSQRPPQQENGKVQTEVGPTPSSGPDENPLPTPTPTPPVTNEEMVTFEAGGDGIFRNGYYTDGGSIACNNYDRQNCRISIPKGTTVTIYVPLYIQVYDARYAQFLDATYGGYWTCNGQQVAGATDGTYTGISVTVNRDSTCGAYFQWQQPF